MIRMSALITSWSRIALAVAAVLAAFAARIWLVGDLGPHLPFVTFFSAVLLAASLGGMASGLVATVLSAAAAGWLYWTEQPFSIPVHDWLSRMSAFVVIGVAVSWLSRVLHMARLKAAQTESLRKIMAEREQAERAIKRNETFLQEIGRMSRVGGWEHDLVTQQAFWTKSLADILELEEGSPPGPGEHLNFYPPGDRERLLGALEKAVSEGEPFDLELQGFTLKRRSIWVRVIGLPVFQEGRCVKLYGSLQEISDRKLAEEQLRQANEEAQAASRAKSVFLANLSHEIRTPLSAILGLTELCRRVRDPDRITANLGMIEDSARLLLAIVGDVLDLSRIEAGKLSLENRSFDLSQVLEKTLDTYRPALKGKDVRQTLQVSEGTPRRLCGDPVRLGQVLGNLVGNAVKFTERGSIAVSVEVSGGSSDEVELHFQVADTGIGIEPGLQDVVFDSFRQADSTFSKVYQGAGLGLAICRELTALMGGRVWVESTPGKGSSFHFTARFGLGEQAGRAQPPVEAGEPFRSGPARVLVAEDNPFNRHVFEEFLTSMGHRVTAVSDGSEALEALRAQPFDLVLMDVQMPGMDGVEVVGRLRKGLCGARAASLPVIALTAYSMAGDRERFIEAGMTDYLSKPVTLDRLGETVARYAPAREAASCPLGALIPEALAYLKERMSLASAMLDAGDLSGAAGVGHDIKGTAMGMVLASVLEPAAVFEKSCRAGDAALAAQYAGEINAALDALQSGLAASPEPRDADP